MRGVGCEDRERESERERERERERESEREMFDKGWQSDLKGGSGVRRKRRAVEFEDRRRERRFSAREGFRRGEGRAAVFEDQTREEKLRGEEQGAHRSSSVLEARGGHVALRGRVHPRAPVPPIPNQNLLQSNPLQGKGKFLLCRG
eukprot:3763179-Rhodomonas_salina.1